MTTNAVAARNIIIQYRALVLYAKKTAAPSVARNARTDNTHAEIVRGSVTFARNISPGIHITSVIGASETPASIK